jgi:hypothetical protein
MNLPMNFILDASQQLFLNRQLESIKAKSYDVLYAELRAPMIIPVDNSAGAGAEKITYRQYDMVGAAKVIANYATDFKRVDIVANEFTATVKSIGAAYGYSVQDIRAAQQAGLDLEQRRANAAVRAVLQQENSIAFFGDANNNLQGLFTNPNVPVAAVAADGAGLLTTFASKSPDQIIRDVNSLINDIFVNTKEVERANSVLFPSSIWALLSSTPRSTVSDTTILQFLKNNHPEIVNWSSLVELETAGPGNTKMMVAYNKSSDKLTLEIPVPYEVFPAQQKGLDFEVPVHERIGGVIIYYPLSLNYAYGI